MLFVFYLIVFYHTSRQALQLLCVTNSGNHAYQVANNTPQNSNQIVLQQYSYSQAPNYAGLGDLGLNISFHSNKKNWKEDKNIRYLKVGSI